MSITLPTMAGQPTICHRCKHWTRRDDLGGSGEYAVGVCGVITTERREFVPFVTVEIEGRSAFGAVDTVSGVEFITPASFGCTEHQPKGIQP